MLILSLADLKGANLTNANLNGAMLEGANLNKANLEGANFKGANVSLTRFPINYRDRLSPEQQKQVYFIF